MLDLRVIAAVLGGEVRGGEVVCPGPNHSRRDRSLSVKLDATGQDVVVHSFADDDPIRCKDYVRKALHLPDWEPKHNSDRPILARGSNGQANGSKGREVEVIYDYCEAD